MTVFKPLAALALLALAACAGRPPQPDWQLEAKGSAERYVSAYLAGSRAADAEWLRTRQALAGTAQPARVARAELLRCAVQVASLDWQPRCVGFEPLREASTPVDAAYADYLLGRWPAAQAELLPPAQRRVAETGLPALTGLQDPLARLLGAAVLLRSGTVAPAAQEDLIRLAVDTASEQGWRRPLLAWLGLQFERAQAQGRQVEARHIRQRLDLLEGRP